MVSGWRGGIYGRGRAGLLVVKRVVAVEGLVGGRADEAQRSRVAATVFIFSVHVSNGLGDVVVVVVDGELWSMATPGRVQALEVLLPV